ncbi:MAG: tRNA (adenosine(37)-N6)-threonylcarbamoyltransferase complex dimerization subunit type 1 TsaB [Candidatus Omnitrophota bacterium]|nr:MAG: tRNA (adenosine(37)-N6)-threonylcarbamoyltransferase complex dimerization subunit type 1 TsaB [Candidatus Omnitrophota bacterium]
MKVLSIETTTKIGSIAVFENENLKKKFAWESDDIAGEITENLKNILKDEEISNFDYFVVSLGPGSWTGIRVGISFVKGLAAGERKKIYGVYTPEGFFNFFKEYDYKVCCLVNAYRGKFYYSFNYKDEFLHTPIKIKEDSLENIFKMIEKKTIIVGPGIADIPQDYLLNPDLIIPHLSFTFPDAVLNGIVAIEKIKRNIPSPPLEPFYGR